MDAAAPADPRPLRRDAERNRARILDAARRLFAERGLNVSMDEVARCAGVGVGTVYRRFSTREELLDALLEDRMGQLLAIGETAAAAEDPWEGLVGFLEAWLGSQADDRGLKDLMLSTGDGHQRVRRVREQLTPLVGDLVERAKAEDALRPDFEGSDVALIGVMVGAIADYARDVEPELWRRYLALLLDGLRARRDGAAPLPVPALTLEQLDCAMAAWRPPRR